MARRKPDLVPPVFTDETIHNIDRAEEEAAAVIAQASGTGEAAAHEPVAELTRWQRIKSWIYRRGGT